MSDWDDGDELRAPKRDDEPADMGDPGPEPPGLLEPGGPDGDTPDDLDLARLLRNDMGNGERLVHRHGADLIHTDGIGWLCWNGEIWEADGGDAAARRRAHQTARAIFREGRAAELSGDFKKPHIDALYKHAATSGNAGRLSAMLGEAAPYLRRASDALDPDPDLLCVENGTLGLGTQIESADGRSATGGVVLQPFQRRDLISRQAPVKYDSDMGCAEFLRFLGRIQPDPAIQGFLQRFFGYCLTGHIGEQIVLLMYGRGANGKSTLLNILRLVLGNYCLTLAFSSLTHDERRRGSEATPDTVRLPGVRLAMASEPELGQRLSESMLKSQTGGEPMTARQLQKPFFEFMPTHKLVLSFNNRPRVSAQDEGTWRRLVMVPFEVTIPKAERKGDDYPKQIVAAEGPGILNWLLDGWRLWREQGLQPPEAVTAATAEYRSESDPLADFLAACVEEKRNAYVTATMLYAAYQAWSRANGVEAINLTRFGRILRERGFHKMKSGVMTYLDIDLTATGQEMLRGGRSDGGGGDPDDDPGDTEQRG